MHLLLLSPAVVSLLVVYTGSIIDMSLVKNSEMRLIIGQSNDEHNKVLDF
jgi:hypothetical protein